MDTLAATGSEYAIETSALTRNFGTFCALDRLDLRISHRCIFGLLGPNGAGKSTTIKILTTLLDATSGSATVAGFDVARKPMEVRRRIGYVPQLLSADGGLTAMENLVLSASLYGLRGEVRDERIREALAFSDLESVADKLVRMFSGGMIRRLEIAQATLHRPEVLFLDEPTIGLDPVARRSVWERLLELKATTGMTILLTTHDMEEADYLCDELAILHRGRLAVVGRPAELKGQLGPDATLSDVFVAHSGVRIEEGGHYREIRETRGTARRLG
ncbi:ATP-binding cassette domain-containing protein [Azoarcus sp. KH32C]|uniref:ATP-binding cassette domain-containing protein n=1 Tax=Azoarcus sp. KH32C TaxID=748247 RepID=UPI000238676B|nr:ATP-binding cassette domain-containing protein [Azoarcus sp. KH32C]BAL25303.1 ABC transporter, antibiotic transport system ATP-binding protein [Azoarcus sp. KH32C]